MDQVYCFHGPEQRAKFGVDVDANGLEVCRRCRRPVLESIVAAAAREDVPPVLVATVPEIAGCRIGGYRGLVSTTVVDRPTATPGRSGNALADALDDVRRQAGALGANAVVGLQMQVASPGDAAVVMLMGTAVVVEATHEAS